MKHSMLVLVPVACNVADPGSAMEIDGGEGDAVGADADAGTSACGSARSSCRGCPDPDGCPYRCQQSPPRTWRSQWPPLCERASVGGPSALLPGLCRDAEDCACDLADRGLAVLGDPSELACAEIPGQASCEQVGGFCRRTDFATGVVTGDEGSACCPDDVVRRLLGPCACECVRLGPDTIGARLRPEECPDDCAATENGGCRVCDAPGCAPVGDWPASGRPDSCSGECVEGPTSCCDRPDCQCELAANDGSPWCDADQDGLADGDWPY